jgi:hypothetical protein
VTWAPDYATSAELKAYLRVGDTADDVFMALWVTAASRSIDKFCKRQFGQTAGLEARTYTAVYDQHIGAAVAAIDDLQDTDDVIVMSGTTEITDYTFEPVNAVAKGKAYTEIHCGTSGELSILAPWGWTSVPSPVKTALFLQGARLAARRDSPFGVAGSPTEGSEIRLLARLDPDVMVILDAYRREVWAA